MKFEEMSLREWKFFIQRSTHFLNLTIIQEKNDHFINIKVKRKMRKKPICAFGRSSVGCWWSFCQFNTGFDDNEQTDIQCPDYHQNLHLWPHMFNKKTRRPFLLRGFFSIDQMISSINRRQLVWRARLFSCQLTSITDLYVLQLLESVKYSSSFSSNQWLELQSLLQSFG